eukprot:gene16888-10285_t
MVATWVKVCFMASLCLQNTMYTLLRRYCVGVLQDGFSASSLVKLGVSALCVSRELGMVGVLKRGKVMLVPAA